MMKTLRIVTLLFAFLAVTLAISSLLAAPVGRPLPPPPVLCGCLCPDGSFITTHAPSAKACTHACKVACEAGSGEF